MGGKQKNKRSTNAENRARLKKKQRLHTMLFPTWFQIAATLRPHEPVHVCLRPLTAKKNRSVMDPDAQDNQHLFVVSIGNHTVSSSIWN